MFYVCTYYLFVVECQECSENNHPNSERNVPTYIPYIHAINKHFFDLGFFFFSLSVAPFSASFFAYSTPHSHLETMTLGSTNSNRRGKLKLWRIKQLQNSGGESFASTEVEESFDETEELELDQQATSTTTTTSATTVCEFISAQVDKGVFLLFVLLQVLRPKRKIECKLIIRY